MDSEKSSEELDEGDLMHLENFESYAKFFATFTTLEAKYEDEIMDLFRYFVGKDMILLATDVVRESAQNEERTQVESEVGMDMESILHDNDKTDTLTNCKNFYLKFQGVLGKEVYSSFELFKTDGVDMTKIDHLLMQKSKDFFLIQKKKGSPVNVQGILFTEEDSVSGWVNRQVKDLRIIMLDDFVKVEAFDAGHTFECFHNLDIDVINAETKALHHSAFLFYEQKEVKQKFYQVLAKLAVAKDNANLKVGKLTTIHQQKNANYNIKEELNKEVEHGFVEHFCEIFRIRDCRKRICGFLSGYDGECCF